MQQQSDQDLATRVELLLMGHPPKAITEEIVRASARRC